MTYTKFTELLALWKKCHENFIQNRNNILTDKFGTYKCKSNGTDFYSSVLIDDVQYTFNYTDYELILSCSCKMNIDDEYYVTCTYFCSISSNEIKLDLREMKPVITYFNITSMERKFINSVLQNNFTCTEDEFDEFRFYNAIHGDNMNFLKSTLINYYEL